MCGRPISQPARGRPRRHCSAACRQVAYRTRRNGERRRRLITLVEGDALEFLDSLPAESVDLIVTDPPYRFARGTKYFRNWFPDLPDSVWPDVLVKLFRVLRPDRHAYILCDLRTAPLFASASQRAGFRLDRELVWNKMTPGLGGGVYRPQREAILLLQKGRRAGNHHRLGDILSYPRVRGKRAYPTEKPVALLGDLIGQSTQPGETVLDPFCGSGSTGHAARALGRRALLADINTDVPARRLRLTAVPLGATKG